jgi:hypothetical protein
VRSFVPGSAEARSPYALVDEVGRAREVLVLTYTAGLEFFERFALANARATGARVTVISDATMVHADPMVVRRSGTQYLDARAVCPSGAFHPKLVLIVGDGHARVAIGSGNLTMAGWHANAETWTVLRADEDGGPDTLREVSGFLRELAISEIMLSAGADDALNRTADELDLLPAEGAGPRLISSLSETIEAQLPTAAEPVSELILYAPFHDARLDGMRALLDRFRPAAWTVYVRAGTHGYGTDVDGSKLEALARERGGRIAWVSHEFELDAGEIVADDRYWHGKLVQCRTPGGLWTLTGSPNLSAPALLRSVADGGNCEIAVISQLELPLTPREGHEPAGGVATLQRRQSKREPRPAALLLAAIAHDAIVTLQLYAPLQAGGVVQRYDIGEDQWRTTTTIPSGSDHYELDISQAPVGQAIRLLLDGGTASNSVFVTDLVRVRRTQGRAIGKVRVSPEEVAKTGLGNELLADLDELRPHLLYAGAIVVPHPHPAAANKTEADGSVEPGRPASGLTLEDFLVACDPVLGQRMTEFALVLPALPGVGISLNDTLGTLDTDEDTDIDDEPDRPPTITEELNRRTPDERARYRTFVERLIDRSPRYPMVVRTLALRTVIHATAAHLWADDRWPTVLADAIRAIGAVGDQPNEGEREAAASLAAAAVALLRTDVRRISRRDEHTMRYEQAGQAIRPLLQHVDPLRVEIISNKDLPGRLAGAAGVLAIDRAIDEIVHPRSGTERAIQILAEENDAEATIDSDGTIVLHDILASVPEPTVIRVLALTQDNGPMFVRGTTTDGKQVLAAWCAPLLAIEKVGANGPFGRAWRLPVGQTPAMLDLAQLPTTDIWWGGQQPRPSDVDELLTLITADR